MENKAVRLKNKYLYFICYVLRTVCLLAASGALMQTFLAEMGFSEGEIYLHSTLLQGSGVAVILIGARFADRGNVLRRAFLIHIPYGALFLAFIPFCIAREASTAALVLLIAISVLQSVGTALCTVCEYKLPYLLFTAEDYGGVLAVSGILSGVVSFGIGELMNFLSAHFSYLSVMTVAFPVCAVLLLGSGVCYLFQRVLTEDVPIGEADMPRKTENKEKVSFLSVLRHPVFYTLLPANLLRGFAAGTVNVLATVAISLGHGTDVTTRMVSVQSVAILVGCFVFGMLSKRISPRIPVFFGSALFLLLPLVLLFGNATLFLFVYALVYFGRTMVDYGVPAALRYAVPAEIAGPYHAFRMILNNGGMLLASAIAPFLSVGALVALTAVTSTLAGCSYLFARTLRTASPAKRVEK